VERLLETKREYKRFVRRREKMMRKEGRCVKGPGADVVAVGGVGSGTEDEVGHEVRSLIVDCQGRVYDCRVDIG